MKLNGARTLTKLTSTVMSEMENLFYNLDEPTAFSSHGPLQKASKKSNRQTDEFLQNQSVYSKHKQVRYKFPRRKTTGEFVFSHVQADLVEMQSFSRFNKGFHYCLNMIDCYSRYAFTIPIKRKTGENVAHALESTFESLKMFPAFLVTDRGKEFLNSNVRTYLKSRHINLINPESEIKCAMVERFNRTWKTRLYKFLTHSKSKKWIDAGEKITTAINNSKHRMTGHTPADVFKGRAIPKDAIRNKKVINPKYKEGDFVRMSRPDAVFRRGFTSGWTEEAFQIVKAQAGDPPVYRLVDMSGEEISGVVYESEIVKYVQ